MNKPRWTVLAALALLVVGLRYLPEPAARRLKGAVRDGLRPLQRLVTRTHRRTRETFRYFRGLGDLALENRGLSEEIVYLRGEVRMARELERDNQRLRELLGLAPRSPHRLVACEVIARDSTGWWQTLRLDKGLADGIVENRAVLTPEGLIGRTVSVSDRTADVVLLSDPACKISARLRRTGIHGVVEGLGGHPGEQPACRMDYLAKTADVQEGDEVVTSGLGGVFPKELLVGRVQRTAVHESGLYQTAWLATAADLGAVEYVFVAVTEQDLTQAPQESRRRPNGEREEELP